MFCPNGFQKDEHGCDICKCYQCPVFKCKSCPHGYRYQLDERKCKTCNCVGNFDSTKLNLKN